MLVGAFDPHVSFAFCAFWSCAGVRRTAVTWTPEGRRSKAEREQEVLSAGATGGHEEEECASPAATVS
jgi:hypothetical protein